MCVCMFVIFLHVYTQGRPHFIVSSYGLLFVQSAQNWTLDSSWVWHKNLACILVTCSQWPCSVMHGFWECVLLFCQFSVTPDPEQPFFFKTTFSVKTFTFMFIYRWSSHQRPPFFKATLAWICSGLKEGFYCHCSKCIYTYSLLHSHILADYSPVSYGFVV